MSKKAKPSAESAMPFFPQRHFATLSECIAHVRSTYGGDVSLTGKDRQTGDVLGSIQAPAFLFRGESSQYPTTTATAQRIPTDPSLSARARSLLPKLATYIEQQLRNFLNMSPMDSAGFAQHYGIPTELLDLTSDPDVAGFFASGGTIGTRGYFAVFPTPSLASSSVLIDLRNHASADRPRRQNAFTLFNREYIDLKSDDCIAELGATWFSFEISEADRARYQSKIHLLDCRTDQVAGVLQLVIDTMVQEHGKLPDEIALWLSKRVAPAPLVARVLKWRSPGQPEEVEFVAVGSTAFAFDEDSERERSYRYWSSRYSIGARSDA